MRYLSLRIWWVHVGFIHLWSYGTSLVRCYFGSTAFYILLNLSLELRVYESIEDNESISRSKSCYHYFHTSCYKQWITRDKHHSCPYCRVDIFDYRISRSESKRDLLNLCRPTHHQDTQPTEFITRNSLSRVNTSSNLLEMASSNMPSF